MQSLKRTSATLTLGTAISLLAPLITVPYLARVLGPASWAPVLLAQAAAAWLVLVLEYGFDLSGTREVARVREDPEARAAVTAGVQGAKLLLAPAVVLLVVLVFLAVPELRGRTALLGWTAAYVALRGFDPLWYFLGVEDVTAAVLVQGSTKLAAAFGVFFVVRGPDDLHRVLLLQAVGAGIATLWLTARMSRHAGGHPFSMTLATEALKRGATLFGFRAASGLFASANVFVVSLVLSPAAVAVFGGAERIIRAGIATLQPITQAVLPRLSYLAAELGPERLNAPSSPPPARRDAARALVRQSLLATTTAGLAIGAVAALAAPQLIALLLGPGYEAAVPVLRLLAILPPLVAVNTVLGLHWAIPLGRDRYFLRAMVASGLLNLVLAVLLAARWGTTGVVTAIIVAEVMQMGLLLPLLRRPSTQ